MGCWVVRLKEGYLLKEVAGEYVLFPVGQNIVDSKSILRINDVGRFLVENLQNEIDVDSLVQIVATKYEATEEDLPRIKADVDFFISKLRIQKLLIE